MGRLVAALITVPLAAGLLVWPLRSSRLRGALVVVAGAALIALSVAAAVLGGGGEVFFGFPAGRLPGGALLALEAALAAFLLAVSLGRRRFAAALLALGQLGAAAFLEQAGRGAEALDPARAFRVDRLALVLLLVAGVIGPLICLHALGYLRDWHKLHPEAPRREGTFFFLMLLFLSSMCGLVCANHLPLFLLFWELTTLCSFLLIGYAGDAEAEGRAFEALEVNLLGGLAFGLALILLQRTPGGLDLARLGARHGGGALLPALSLLALAGLTKSAQLPFCGWLLGAMVAPAPTSALLHSSTMVKAGVFLLLRLSPALGGTAAGTALALIGLGTFFAASLAATTEENLKRVLALSTIGNLGLVVACAGIATPEAIWVAVLLVIFHAAAKSLLFLVAGTLECGLHTKEVEGFDHLLSRLPRVSALALTGIAGMFLAPFGVVIAKWSALRAFLAVPGWLGALSLVLLAFGSSCMIFYWGKLLLKIVAVRRVGPEERVAEQQVPRSEWAAEWAHAALVVALAAGVGLLSSRVASPIALAGAPPRLLFHLGPGLVAGLVAAVLALPALSLWERRHVGYDVADIYAGGRATDARHGVWGALGSRQVVSQRGYYLEGLVDGARVLRLAGACAALVLIGLLALATLVPP